LHL
jgi:hypothetical protein